MVNIFLFITLILLHFKCVIKKTLVLATTNSLFEVDNLEFRFLAKDCAHCKAMRVAKASCVTSWCAAIAKQNYV